jgi:hypothetical protein
MEIAPVVDFYDVHRDAINKADGRVRRGEIWNVVMREPHPIVGKPTDAMPAISFTILMFRATPDGRLEPARDFDRSEIDEWNKRHRNTDPESFGLPGLSRR